MSISFRPEVKTSDPNWVGNACRFATEAEAMAYVQDLSMRWTAVRDIRVVESDDAVNYVWENGKARSL